MNIRKRLYNTSILHLKYQLYDGYRNKLFLYIVVNVYEKIWSSSILFEMSDYILISQNSVHVGKV